MTTTLDWTAEGSDLRAVVEHEDGDYDIGIFKADGSGYNVQIDRFGDFLLSGYWFERQREAKAFCEGAMAMRALCDMEAAERGE